MKVPTRTEIGAWLKRARKAAKARAPHERRKDFAQAGVANRIGVRERAVREWEKGHTTPLVDQFFLLVSLYGAEIELLRLITHANGKRRIPPDDVRMIQEWERDLQRLLGDQPGAEERGA